MLCARNIEFLRQEQFEVFFCVTKGAWYKKFPLNNEVSIMCGEDENHREFHTIRIFGHESMFCKKPTGSCVFNL